MLAVTAPHRPRLEVYVARHCSGCLEARRLAREVATRCAAIDVCVVDLDDGTPPPEIVLAVPTYVLNGSVTWLGNPSPEELFARLREVVA